MTRFPPLHALALGAALVGAAACDFPTRIPVWDTEWDAVLVTDTITTSDLLPEGMRIVPGGFVLDSFSVSSAATLGQVCPLCTCFEGAVPALDIGPQDWPVRMPPGLSEAVLDGGKARMTLHNHVGFDVLADGAGGEGWLTVEFIDQRDGRTLDEVRIDGSFPPGDSLVVTWDLSDLVLSGYLVARVRGHTPGSGCQDVDITPQMGFRADMALQDVLASTVWVLVSDAAVAFPSRDMELPAAVADRLRPDEAEVRVEVELSTRLPTSLELLLSAAATPEALFTSEAALYTPLPLPEGVRDAAVRIEKAYVVDVGALESAERLYLATRNTVTGPRRVELHGDEGVEYRVRLRARIPSR